MKFYVTYEATVTTTFEVEADDRSHATVLVATSDFEALDEWELCQRTTGGRVVCVEPVQP